MESHQCTPIVIYALVYARVHYRTFEIHVLFTHLDLSGSAWNLLRKEAGSSIESLPRLVAPPALFKEDVNLGSVRREKTDGRNSI